MSDTVRHPRHYNAGVSRVYCVKNGYAGGDAGPAFLTSNNVEVVYVDGPADPRSVP